MILRKKKFQLGGAMTEYVPIDLRVTDKSGMVQPSRGSGGVGASRGRAPAVTANPLDKAKALKSDREALRNEIEATKTAIQNGMTSGGEGFTKTDEYKSLSQHLRTLTTTGVANLESNKNKYAQVYQATKKAAEAGDIAMLGDKVFVLDNSTGAYDIVDRTTAAKSMTKVHGKDMIRFVPQTVATALNVRADDPTFSLSGRGGELEAMIRSVKDSNTLNTSMNAAFKGTGYSKDMSTSIVTDQGDVDINDLLKYSSEMDSSPQKQQATRGNQAALEAARQTFAGVLEGPMRDALRDKAWYQYYKQYAGKPNAPEAKGWVESTVDKQINQTMQKYLRTEYSDKLKAGDSGEDGGQDLSKVTVNVNKVDKAFYAPTGSIPLENKKILDELEKKEGNKDRFTGILHIGASPIAGIEKEYNAEFPEGPKTLQNSYFTDQLVGSDMNWTLPDGTPFNKIGSGAAMAVKSNKSPITILHKVPMIKDPKTNRYSIAWDLMNEYTTFDAKVQEKEQATIHYLIQEKKLSKEQAVEAAASQSATIAKEVAKEMGLSNADHVVLRTAAMMEVLMPSSEIDSEHEGMFTSDTTKDDETHYEKMYEDDIPGVWDDLSKTMIIAPTNELSNITSSEFGMPRKSMKMDQLLKQLGATQTQASLKWDTSEYIQTLRNNLQQ